ncbi:Uncharacterised protein [Mycobacteroides abscessus subsp. abscessus]|nr:Uncharacterised protein [Mycobacteroides abscessus subsp. abscessus]
MPDRLNCAGRARPVSTVSGRDTNPASCRACSTVFIDCGVTSIARARSALDQPGFFDSTRIQTYWGNGRFSGANAAVISDRKAADTRYINAPSGCHSCSSISVMLTQLLSSR